MKHIKINTPVPNNTIRIICNFEGDIQTFQTTGSLEVRIIDSLVAALFDNMKQRKPRNHINPETFVADYDTYGVNIQKNGASIGPQP